MKMDLSTLRSTSCATLIGCCILTGRSIPTNIYPPEDPHRMERAFRDVCSWSRFTYDSANPDWMYSYFISRWHFLLCSYLLTSGNLFVTNSLRFLLSFSGVLQFQHIL